MKKDRLHKIYDIGSLLALVTTVTAIVWQHGHDGARMDFLAEQINDVQQSQDRMDNKVDKIYEILMVKR